MTHRYVGPMGRKLEGNLPRAHEVQGTARLLVQQCLNEIGYRGGWGQAVRQLALRDGTIVKAIVIKNIRGFEPIVRVEVFAPQRTIMVSTDEKYWLSAVWIPEGIVVTPATAEARLGWGSPRRDGIDGSRINPPFGTVITDIRNKTSNQVIINRFENNKYLDKPDFVQGIDDVKVHLVEPNPLLADTAEAAIGSGWAHMYPPYVHWPFSYTPDSNAAWDEWYERNGYRNLNIPGLNKSVYESFEYTPAQYDSDGYPLHRQFDDARHSLIFEAETETWYGHWPEETLFHTPAAEAVFQLTNELRAGGGRAPLMRPLRGHGHLGLMILLEIGILGEDLLHDNPLYRYGHQTLTQRAAACMGHPTAVGENLFGITPSSNVLSTAFGEAAVEWWTNSPGHYDNLMDEVWDYTTTHDPFLLANVPLETLGGAKCVVASQCFYRPDIQDVAYKLQDEYLPDLSNLTYWKNAKADTLQMSGWVSAASVGNETNWGVVSWLSHEEPYNSVHHLVNWAHQKNDLDLTEHIFPRRYGHPLVVFFQGRAIVLATTNLVSDYVCSVIVGATVFQEDGDLVLRVVFSSVKASGLFGGDNYDWSKNPVRLFCVKVPFLTADVVPLDPDYTLGCILYGHRVIIEDSLLMDRLDSWEPARVFTKGCFSRDGTHGVFTSIQRNNSPDTFLDNQRPSDADVRFQTISVTDGKFSIDSVYSFQGNVTFSVPLFHHYDASGALQHWLFERTQAKLFLTEDELAYAGTDSEDFGRIKCTTRLSAPSGTVFDLVDLEWTELQVNGNGDPLALGREVIRPGYVSLVSYINIEHEQVVFMRVYWEPEGRKTQLHRTDICNLYLNNTLLKSYTGSLRTRDHTGREYLGWNSSISSRYSIAPFPLGYSEVRSDDFFYTVGSKEVYPWMPHAVGMGVLVESVWYNGENILVVKVFGVDQDVIRIDLNGLESVPEIPKSDVFIHSTLDIEALTGVSDITDLTPLGVM